MTFHTFAAVLGVAGGIVGTAGFLYSLWVYRDMKRG